MKNNSNFENIREELLSTLHNNEYISNLGIELISLKEGYAKGKIKLKDKHLNPYGSVHGGCLYSLADTICGFAACSFGCYASTISGTMNFIKPAMNTKNIYCTATKIRQGKTVAFYNAEITNDDGEILETGSFSFYILKNTTFSK